MQMNVAPSLEQAAEAPDPRIAVAEAQLAMLEELSACGMSRVEALDRHARPGEHAADAFARLSRAIRCALILEARIEKELAALKAGAWISAAESSDTDSWSPDPSAESETLEDEDMSAPDGLVERESPDRESFGHILKLPFKDAVRWICRELGMDGDEFLRTHPLTPALSPAPAPARAPALAPAPRSSDEVRAEVRERVVEEIHTELAINANVDMAWAVRVVGALDERLYDTGRYDAVIHLPLMEAASAILSDLGLDPRRTGEALPPPDPPPRMIRAP